MLHAVDAIVAGRTAVVNGALAGGGDVLQATLGILTLLHQVPIDLALAHQAVAIVVLTLAVFQAERLVARPRRAGAAETRAAGRATRLNSTILIF